VPAEVRNLLDYSELKTLAERVGIESVDRRAWVANIKFHQQAKVDPEKLMRLVGQTPGAQFTPGGVLRLPLEGLDTPSAVLARLQERLLELV
jgi:transcription-repair coupling factor (superfamily II helicase)